MSTRVRQTAGDTVFEIVVMVIVVLAVLVCVLPMLNVVAVSFSSDSAILNQKVTLWPVDFTLQSYQAIWSDNSMVWSLLFTALITFLYTAIAMVLSVFA